MRQTQKINAASAPTGIMKIPVQPPATHHLLRTIVETTNQPNRLVEILSKGIGPTSENGQYRHWDTQRHLQPPNGMTVEEWWLATKLARQSSYRKISLKATNQKPFQFAMVDEAWQMVTEIDKFAGGNIKGSWSLSQSSLRDTFLIRSLMEEAITSSQLEGAATTREIAKDMLQTGRMPNDRSERMIFNNYLAMRRIQEIKKEKLSPEKIFELHRIVTEQTLDNTTAAGRFRDAHEQVHVVDDLNRPLYTPPPASELSERMKAMCAFANGESDVQYVHPVIRAILLHFWLAYDHPFVDGNGRTARTLFYWNMVSNDYWLFEYLSISSVIKRAPIQYGRAFLYTETDDNDLTYFILNQLRVILNAIKELHDNLAKHLTRLDQIRDILSRSPKFRTLFNHRQLTLLDHAIQNPGFVYSTESHMRSHGISLATSRADLTELAKFNLLRKYKKGHAFLFEAPRDLQTQIHAVSKR